MRAVVEIKNRHNFYKELWINGVHIISFPEGDTGTINGKIKLAKLYEPRCPDHPNAIHAQYENGVGAELIGCVSDGCSWAKNLTIGALRRK